MDEKDFAERLKSMGRNDQCPCGSGKKYKKCHLLKDEEAYKKELQKEKEAVAKENVEGAAGVQMDKPTHFNEEVRPKLKLSKTIAHRNVPRRQAGK